MQRLFGKTLPAWPNPMDSMGPQINTRTRKIGGSTAWFPRGPALKHFSDKIRPEVERILDNIELPEVEKLIVKLYMIGRSEQKANPIIMICCSDKATRKEAEASIRESGLLDQHDNCGFGLVSTGLPLETSFLPRPLGKAIYLDMNASAEDALKVDVYGLTEPGIGRKLGFVASSQSGRTVQCATGGPIIRLGGHLYQLTVAHVMKHNPISNSHQEHDWDADEWEFDGQSDEDDNENLILSRGSISPGESLRDTEPDSDQQRSQQSSPSSDSYPEIPDTLFSDSQNFSASSMSPKSVQTEHGDDKWDPSTLLRSLSMPCWNFGELDYLMIKLTAEASGPNQELNQVTIDELSKSRSIQVDDIASVKTDVTSILAITSRGPIPGDIVSDSMSFKAGGSSSFQQLLTVLLSKGLREGDSGSAIIDSQTGHFYGHVVLGVDGDCVAYVLPSPSIMAKITTQFLQLPSFHRVNKDERPGSAPAVQLHRTEARTAVDSLSKLISGAGPSSYDQKVRPHEVSVPMDDLLTIQRELKDAWTAVDTLNTELRDKRSAPEGISKSGSVDLKPLEDMQSAVSDRNSSLLDRQSPFAYGNHQPSHMQSLGTASETKSMPMPKPAVDEKNLYGYLYEANKTPTKVLDALLRAIALYITNNIGDKQDQTLSPTKLAAFYKAVGGDSDRLFLNSPSESISLIWQVHGCQHTLQPTNNDYEAPAIPSLNPRGFVRWQSIHILIEPKEHVPYIMFAVQNWDLKNPDTGESFPKDISAIAFPTVPDPDVTAWHAACGEKLRKNATLKASPRPTSPPEANRLKTGANPTLDRTPFSAIANGPYYRGAKFLDAFKAAFPTLYWSLVLLSLGIIGASLGISLASSGGGQTDKLKSWRKGESTYSPYYTLLATMASLCSVLPLFMVGVRLRRSSRPLHLLSTMVSQILAIFLIPLVILTNWGFQLGISTAVQVFNLRRLDIYLLLVEIVCLLMLVSIVVQSMSTQRNVSHPFRMGSRTAQMPSHHSL